MKKITAIVFISLLSILLHGFTKVDAHSKNDIISQYNHVNAWGMLTSIDLKECDPELIRSADAIKNYVAQLCDLIDMKRFGETQVVHFGEEERVAGYSMTQLIETSLISGHFANINNSVYIDVFSCKPYDPQVVADFTKKYFKGKNYQMNVLLRE